MVIQINKGDVVNNEELTEYFKNEDEHIDKLDAKQCDLTYSR